MTRTEKEKLGSRSDYDELETLRNKKTNLFNAFLIMYYQKNPEKRFGKINGPVRLVKGVLTYVQDKQTSKGSGMNPKRIETKKNASFQCVFNHVLSEKS